MEMRFALYFIFITNDECLRTLFISNLSVFKKIIDLSISTVSLFDEVSFKFFLFLIKDLIIRKFSDTTKKLTNLIIG